MLKKTLILTLALACALSLAACSSREATPAGDPSSQSDASEIGESSGESGATPAPSIPSINIEAPVKQYTTEEAKANNASIAESDLELIQFEEGKGSETVVIHTTMGDIEIDLYRDQAPLAVDNFVTHAKEGYYNGMNFYKVMDNFLIQSGAPTGKAPKSIYKDESGEAVPFENEFSLSLWNFRGALVMQNKGVDRPKSNTSEFFIVQAGPVEDPELLEEMKAIGYPEKLIAKYREVGGIPGFDWRYTVFGMVSGESMEVVDAIAAAPADSFGTPEETILIESITVK